MLDRYVWSGHVCQRPKNGPRRRQTRSPKLVRGRNAYLSTSTTGSKRTRYINTPLMTPGIRQGTGGRWFRSTVAKGYVWTHADAQMPLNETHLKWFDKTTTWVPSFWRIAYLGAFLSDIRPAAERLKSVRPCTWTRPLYLPSPARGGAILLDSCLSYRYVSALLMEDLPEDGQSALWI
ncbi:hypothetical protein CONLIGDRAFT_638443 [Coniochaeta ligniaria NRRL 30616]|uniref:Uncharacterized protein n=1 Tax=Coniochaeta ligniaria NRRL 30616 TaxID=1408157 RepID=A0A1J7IXL3_9PEZI|nr:hypothetical protein CONLIGDRAFT_638443 [Coniochaeta ligniaria NRRL 30616]